MKNKYKVKLRQIVSLVVILAVLASSIITDMGLTEDTHASVNPTYPGTAADTNQRISYITDLGAESSAVSYTCPVDDPTNDAQWQTYLNEFLVGGSQDTLGTLDYQSDTATYYVTAASGLEALAWYSKYHDSTNLKIYLNVITAANANYQLESTYPGLGSEAYPFKGSISLSMNATITLSGSTALCDYMSTTADIYNTNIDNAKKLTITCENSFGGLTQILVIDSSSYTLSSGVEVNGTILNNYSSANCEENDATISKAHTGMIAGCTKWNTTGDFDLAVQGTVNCTSVTASNLGDAGNLIGRIQSTGGAAFTLDLTDGQATLGMVTANMGSAGGYFGTVAAPTSLQAVANTTLTIPGTKAIGGNTGVFAGTLEAELTVSDITSIGIATDKMMEAYADRDGKNASGVTISEDIGAIGCAGTFVGYVKDTGAFTSENAVTVTSMVIGGGSATGGAYGRVDNAVITVPQTTVTAVDIYSDYYGGGYIGRYRLGTEGSADTATTVTIDETVQLGTVTLFPLAKNTNGKLCAAGGLIGSVEVLSGNFTYDYSQALTAPITSVVLLTTKMTNNNDGNTRGLNAGGLVGRVAATNRMQTLQILGNGRSLASSCAEDSKALYSYGGLVGTLESNTYLELANVSANYTVKKATCYGALVACARNSGILDISGTNTVQGSENLNTRVSAVGNTGMGTIVHWHGDEDNAGVLSFASTLGNVVVSQNNSLIYSDNFSISVSGSVYGDEIGNYGQIIRNDAFTETLITANTNRTVSLHPLVLTSGTSTEITLADKTDLAALAITIASEGYFSCNSSITSDTGVDSLLASDITVAESINLTNTGIESLTRTDDSQSFSGKIEGQSSLSSSSPITITLSLGELDIDGNSYANTRENAENGRTGNYAHRTIGLFGKLSDGASVKELIIAGNVNLNTNGANEVYAGSVAGGATGSIVIEHVKSTVLMNGNQGTASVLGGVLGSYTGSNLSLTESVTEADIWSFATTTGMGIVGGMVGRITAEDVSSEVGATLDFKDNTVKTEIAMRAKVSSATTSIRVGGLISTIANNGSNRAELMLQGITLDGVIMDLDAVTATYWAGGLLGYEWKKVNAEFVSSETNTIAVRNVSYSMNGTGNFGGLITRLRGQSKFTIGSDLTITGSISRNAITNGTADGMLVGTVFGETDGGTGDTNRQGSYVILEAKNNANTYAEMFVTNLEDESLTIPQTSDKYHFDAIVGNNILDRNDQGIPERGSVTTIETGAADGTVPDDSYWSALPTNPNARYYYNVEEILASTIETPLAKTGNFEVNTKKDLLAWNVISYAAGVLSLTDLQNKISSTMVLKANIDISDLCFYPVNFNQYTHSSVNGIINLDGHTLTFGVPDYDGSTNGTTNWVPTWDSQVNALQSGLLLDVDGNLTVKGSDNQGVFGSISGKINSWTGYAYTRAGNVNGNAKNITAISTFDYGSGAIIAGTMSGTYSATDSKILNLTLKNIRVNELYVQNLSPSSAAHTDYSPLLVNQITQCVTGTISGIRQTYSSNTTKAATALIGYVGNANAYNVNLMFSDVALDGAIGSSVFTHATLLERLQYLTGTTNYNFDLGEDWNEGTKAHIGNVTYGSELKDNETEYYDQPLYVKASAFPTVAANVVNDWSGYRPYVCETDAVTYANLRSLTVNKKSADITEGWGTYDNPYVISSGKQLETIASIINGGESDSAWTINYPKNQDLVNVSTTEGFDVYTGYASGSYTSTDTTKTLTLEALRSWLSGAYFMISSNIEVDMPAGIGTAGNPFHGVLVGDGEKKITVSTSATDWVERSLIAYADGCVVKGVQLVYDSTGTYQVYTAAAGNVIYHAFGGVIGTILGGDNVLDNVEIQGLSTANLLTGDRFSLIGGYVGEVRNGGLIFRNIADEDNSLCDETSLNALGDGGAFATYYYFNPYVGRVYNGYVLNENTEVMLSNTDKNYTIAQVENSGTNTSEITVDITSDVYTYTVHDAEELFLFQAAVNSGALEVGEATSGYKAGRRVRTASYANVGVYSSVGSSDTTNGYISDDSFSVSTGTPYLLTFFSNTACRAMKAKSCKIELGTTADETENLAATDTETFDLSVYANGFRGIGGLYGSDGGSAEVITYKPSITGFDGHYYGVTLQMNRLEYFTSENLDSNNIYPYETNHSLSIGLFNELAVGKYISYDFKNITITGSVAIHTTLSSGATKLDPFTLPLTYKDKAANEKYLIAAGGFLGRMTYIGDVTSTTVSISDMSFSNFLLQSQRNAGSVVGYISTSNSTTSITISNCEYDKVVVRATVCAGGIVGFARAYSLTIDGCGGTDGWIEAYRTKAIGNTAQTMCVSNTRSGDAGVGGILGFAYYDNSYSGTAVQSRVTVSNSSLTHLVAVLYATESVASNLAGTGGIVGRVDGINATLSDNRIENAFIYSGTLQISTKNAIALSDEIENFCKSPIDNYTTNVDCKQLMNWMVNYFDNSNGTKYYDGTAGGMLGGAGHNSYGQSYSITIKNSTLVGSGEDGLVVIGGLNDAAAVFADNRYSGTLEVSGVKLGSSGDEADEVEFYVFGTTRTAGIVAMQQFAVNTYISNAEVGDSRTNSYFYSGTEGKAAGILSESDKNTVKELVISDCTVQYANIAGITAAGIVAKEGSTATAGGRRTQIKNIEVSNNWIYSYSREAGATAGGVIGYLSTAKVTIPIYIDNVNVENNRIEISASNTYYVGGLIGYTSTATLSIYANQVRLADNTIGRGATNITPSDPKRLTYPVLTSKWMTFGNARMDADAVRRENGDAAIATTIDVGTTIGESNAVTYGGAVIGSVSDTKSTIRILGVSRIVTEGHETEGFCYNDVADYASGAQAKVSIVYADYGATQASSIFTEHNYSMSGTHQFFGDSVVMNTLGESRIPAILNNLSWWNIDDDGLVVSVADGVGNNVQTWFHNLEVGENTEAKDVLEDHLTTYQEHNTQTIDGVVTELSTGNSKIDNLPMLYLTGDPAELLKDFVNLLTKGGFSDWTDKLQGAECTVTATKYEVDAEGNVQNLGSSVASVIYNAATKNFETGNEYDRINPGGISTFTVLTVTFGNMGGTYAYNETTGLLESSSATATSYQLDVPIYFPQVLEVQSTCIPYDNEEYTISELLANTDLRADIDATGISATYMEYIYNEVRNENAWNFSKTLLSADVNGAASQTTLFPAGTTFTLIDLNSETAAGYRAYYHTLAQAGAMVSLSDFSRREKNEETGNLETVFYEEDSHPLDSLKSVADYGAAALYGTSNYPADGSGTTDYINDYGVERYVVVVQLPENNTVVESYGYFLKADLQVSHNVTIDWLATNMGTLQVWKTIRVNMEGYTEEGVPANAIISADGSNPLLVNIHPTIQYPSADYKNVMMADNVDYAIMKCYIENETSLACLPAGTVLSVTAPSTDGNSMVTVYETTLTSEQEYIQFSLTDENLLATAFGEELADYYTIEMDFSSVSPSDYSRCFGEDTTEQFRLYTDLYVTANPEYPEYGSRSNEYYTPLTYTKSTSITLGVNVTSDTLHLGVNWYDIEEETNDGIIRFEVSGTIPNYTNVATSRLDFRLYKKSSSGEYVPVTDPSELTRYLAGLRYISDDEEPVVLSDLTATMSFENTNDGDDSRDVLTEDVTADGSFDAYFQLEINPDIDYYSNYQLQVTYTGTIEGSEETVTGDNIFIYTVARIKNIIE